MTATPHTAHNPYTPHSIETAPPAAKDILAGAAKAYGFIPNLLGVMAEAPALLKAYTTLSSIFEDSGLTATERQIVLLSASFENGCDYCMAAHSVIAGMQKVPAAVVGAVRDGTPIDDPKLEALRRFTAAVVSTRGRPSATDTAAFLGAGYSRARVLDVVLGVGLKTLSNYTNHIAETPLDEAFAAAAWSKAA